MVALLGAVLPVCRVASGQSSPGVSWYLTGRVITEDGWAPDERVDIVTTCNGQSYIAAHTDKAGTFSFRLGSSGNRTLQDASISTADGSFGRSASSMGPPPSGNTQTTSTDTSQQGTSTTTTTPATTTPSPSPSPRSSNSERALVNCDMQAKLPGYRSESISLANRKPGDNPDLGTIILHRLARGEGGIVSVTALATPKDARKAFEKGRRAEQRKRLEEAQQDFQQAARIYPQYAAAWCELGKLAVTGRQWDVARMMFATAIHADAKYLDSYLQLAALQAVAGEWPELAKTTGAALQLDARDYPQAYYLNALANFNLNHADAAEKSAREAERLDTRRRFPGSWQVLSRILLMRRQFTEAAAQMREYLRIAPRAPDANAVRTRLAEVEKLSAAAPGAPPE